MALLSNWDHSEKDFYQDSFLCWSPEAYSPLWELSWYLGPLGIIANSETLTILKGLYTPFLSCLLFQKRACHREDAATQYLKQNVELIA